MKRFSFILLLVFSLVLVGCVETESDVTGDTLSESDTEPTEQAAPSIEILGMSTSEDDLNILRDQLTNNGFDVELNIQPDRGSYNTQKEAGNYDLAVNSWTTVTGNPDYRSEVRR